MSGAIPPLPQYAFMAWTTLPLPFFLYFFPSFVFFLFFSLSTQAGVLKSRSHRSSRGSPVSSSHYPQFLVSINEVLESVWQHGARTHSPAFQVFHVTNSTSFLFLQNNVLSLLVQLNYLL